VNNAPYKPVKPSGSLYIEPGGSFSYSAQTYDPDGDQVRFRFRWDDGNMSDWTGFVSGNETVSMAHEWYQIANFSVQVIAQDIEGLNSSWSEALVVFCSFSEEDTDTEKIDPVALFSTAENETSNFSISFNSSMSFDEDGNITSYFWDFGDGFTSTAMNPDHSYDESGWYNVTLIVTDDDGNMYSKTMSVYVASKVDETDTIDESGKDASFPWVFVLFGLGGAVLALVVVFRKQIFSLFFEIVEVDDEEDSVNDSPITHGTFVDQIKNVEQKLNPFSHQQGFQRNDPMGLRADSEKSSSETDIKPSEPAESKKKDIHFIRNMIDAHFSQKDDEEE
jgi:PKD repeat protein